MEQVAPLAFLEQRLRTAQEHFRISKTAILWYQESEQLFYLRLENGGIVTSFSFDRAVYTLLNSIGKIEPISAQEQNTRLYTLQDPTPEDGKDPDNHDQRKPKTQ